MKIRLQTLITLAAASAILCGCGKSSSTSSTNAEAQLPATPAPTTEAAPAPDTTQPAAAAPETTPAAQATAAGQTAKAAAEAAQTGVTDLTSQFAQVAGAQADKTLGSIGAELADKAKSLAQSLGTNESAKSRLDGTLQSLAAGKDSDALGSAFQMVQDAKLTPEQVDVAKQVGNLTSAYVVQKNFSSLDGAQGDVANIVNSLRDGQVSAAVPSIQKVAQNANLTQPQKELIGTLADKYAPGLKKATDTLQQGLQGVKSLPGLGK